MVDSSWFIVHANVFSFTLFPFPLYAFLCSAHSTTSIDWMMYNILVKLDGIEVTELPLDTPPPLPKTE